MPLRKRKHGGQRRTHKARAELTLGRDSAWPLEDIPATSDPLTAFADVCAGLRDDLHETIEIAIDLVPLSGRQRRRWHVQAMRDDRDGSSDAAGLLRGLARSLWYGDTTSRPARRPQRLRTDGEALQMMQRRQDLRARHGKLNDHTAAFACQVLVMAESDVRGRAKAHFQGIIAAFNQWSGHNHFRVVGLDLGLAFLGSDRFGRRRRFDRRLDRGIFAPAGRNAAIVSAKDVAAFLRPPTKHCASQNVLRGPGSFAPPPLGLPDYAYQPGVLPLGTVRGRDGARRLVGVRVEDTLFDLHGGKSGFGKTNRSLNMFLHVALRLGEGGCFVDPHKDALRKAMVHLTDPGVCDRVELLDFSRQPDGHDAHVMTWNVMSIHGCPRHALEAKRAAIVDSFATATGWGRRNQRAMNLLEQATTALLELGMRLPAQVQPTLFQLTTFLSNETWRHAVLPHLSPRSRDFWTNRFPHLADEAITPITNVVDRLRSNDMVAAILGASTSTFDLRRSMDSRRLVLVCPKGPGRQATQLIANFVLNETVRAFLSREDIEDEAARPRFWCWFDEAQQYEGGSSDSLAVLFEQCRKFGARVFMLTQNINRLSPDNREAAATNRSHQGSFAVSREAATRTVGELGSLKPEQLLRLPEYVYAQSVKVGPAISAPFLVRGVSVDDLWGEHAKPEDMPRLVAALDRRRRRVGDVLDELDTLDDRIVAALGHGRPGGGSAVDDGTGPRPHSIRHA
ncbi:MAG: hypothetical protein IT198_17305 [Acidimicrobiia bacterium]|nr:hypothetical protein [Acidimicrobiia bacterium]